MGSSFLVLFTECNTEWTEDLPEGEGAGRENWYNEGEWAEGQNAKAL
jgi:hypothetical protein